MLAVGGISASLHTVVLSNCDQAKLWTKGRYRNTLKIKDKKKEKKGRQKGKQKLTFPSAFPPGREKTRTRGERHIVQNGNEGGEETHENRKTRVSELLRFHGSLQEYKRQGI